MASPAEIAEIAKHVAGFAIDNRSRAPGDRRLAARSTSGGARGLGLCAEIRPRRDDEPRSAHCAPKIPKPGADRKATVGNTRD
jgi:hypothetical protein